MPFPIGKILMAYRPLYLRGLLMDGQYKLPASTTEARGKKVTPTTTEVPACRASSVCLDKPLHGASR